MNASRNTFGTGSPFVRPTHNYSDNLKLFLYSQWKDEDLAAYYAEQREALYSILLALQQ